MKKGVKVLSGHIKKGLKNTLNFGQQISIKVIKY